MADKSSNKQSNAVADKAATPYIAVKNPQQQRKSILNPRSTDERVDNDQHAVTLSLSSSSADDVIMGRSFNGNQERSIAKLLRTDRIVATIATRTHHQVPLWIAICALIIAIVQGRNIAHFEGDIGIITMIVKTIEINLHSNDCCIHDD